MAELELPVLVIMCVLLSKFSAEGGGRDLARNTTLTILPRLCEICMLRVIITQ